MRATRLTYGSTIPGQPFWCSDLLWRTHFKTPDPFFFYEREGDSATLLINALEYERAKKEAASCVVLCVQDLKDALETLKSLMSPGQALTLHPDTPCSIAQKLQHAGIQTTAEENPWFPERASKTALEIGHIVEVQRTMERVFEEVMRILQKAQITADSVLVDAKGHLITAESIRKFMDIEFMRLDCFAVATIIACGDQAVDPHYSGSGPLKAHLPIVFDIFPRSKENFWWADMSRTVVKGKPTPEARKMYQTVFMGQHLAMDMIHAGVDGSTIQKAVEEFFAKNGYITGIQQGVMQGFFHSVGHGVGLDIHESPRIRKIPEILPEGAVVTVEPGLYYLGIGGVRIEDMVVVTRDGYENLTRFPKELEAMIL